MFEKIRPITWGIVLSCVAILITFFTGMWMGLDEGGIREGFKASGMTVLDSLYNGDEAALDAMVGTAWAVTMRAHVHWAGMGAAALAMCFILLLVKVPNWYKQISSIFLGFGAVVYPLSWWYIAQNLTVLGKAVKDDVHWIAALGIGPIVAGAIAVVAALIYTFFKTGKEAKNTDKSVVA